MRLVRAAMAAVCLILLSSTASAQQDIPTIELSGGYQFLRTNGGTDHSTFPLGWYADLAFRLTDYTSLVIQGGGSAETIDEQITTGSPGAILGDVVVRQFMAGLRYGAPSDSAVQPFVQLLLGGVNVWDDVTVVPAGSAFNQQSYWVIRFGAQIGGGVSIRLAEKVGIRGDVAYLKFTSDSKTDHIEDFIGTGSALRAGAGLIFWF